MPSQNNTARPKSNKGQFRKGHDARRHRFTREECQNGFWAAINSVASRYPEAHGPRGHMTVKFLPAVLRQRERGRKQG